MENKKNTLTIFLIIIILVLGGYLVYDKVIDKENLENEIVDQEEQEENPSPIYQYVGDAFAGTISLNWPEDIVAKENGDPDTVVHKIEIPKILIETEETKKINDKIYNNIYNNHSFLIDGFKDYSNYSSHLKKHPSKILLIADISVTYGHIIKDDILFILINENSSSTRSGSSSTYSIYYYDIINDKELSVNDICNKFNISLNEIKIIDESAENIYAVMPLYGNTYDVYYKQNATCPSYHCQDVVTITTR